MNHEQDIQRIIEQIKIWPDQDRVALAYRILRDIRKQTRQPPPRNTANRALGIAAGEGPPPDDATVRRWIEEHRMRKYG